MKGLIIEMQTKSLDIFDGVLLRHPLNIPGIVVIFESFVSIQRIQKNCLKLILFESQKTIIFVSK